VTVALHRNDRSVVGHWWWTVDHLLLFGLILLICYGAVLTFAASPPAAARIRIDLFHFVRQQMILIPFAFVTMIGVSFGVLARSSASHSNWGSSSWAT